jgi:hypothetical protein
MPKKVIWNSLEHEGGIQKLFHFQIFGTMREIRLTNNTIGMA